MAKRTRITRPYPTHSFQDTLPVAETIQRVNGGQPVETKLLAEALGTSAKSSTFMQKLNASSKYGLTAGSYSDEFIELTELGESITSPQSAEEREASILDAVTKPEVFSKFYQIYTGKRMPEDIYASNTLVRKLGVPRELTEECLGIIRRNGLVSGLVSDQSGILVVRAISESEEAGNYDTESLVGRPSESVVDGEDTGGDRSRGEAEILVVADADDPIQGEVSGLMEGLSAPCRSLSLDGAGDRIISQELSEALDLASGCVFVWPRQRNPESDGARNPRLWAAMGALSYRLGEKLIVLVRDGDDTATEWNPAFAGMTVARVARGESVYPKLVVSLVQSGIVRISMG